MGAHAQQAHDILQRQLQSYAAAMPQEKLFVHTDKEFYLAGETMWFKIYQADAGTHAAINFSKVAYVELLDATGKAVLQAKIGLGKDNGMGNGSLTVPSYIVSGNYVLRAYTNWMKNTDAACFFHKVVSIVNTSRRPDWQQLEKGPAYTVRFFPEGGNLVYGLRSRIGFEVKDQYGKGVNASGSIIDERNDTVARFQTGLYGIGSFYFQPAPGSRYRAWVKPGPGGTLAAGLPAIFEQGYAMQLSETQDGQLKITVAATDGYARQPVYLLAHTRRQVKVAAALHFSNGVAAWTFAKDKLGEGVSHITIFNEQQQAVCERLYFKKPAAALSIGIRTDQQEYGLRSKATIELSAAGAQGQPAAAGVSISVFMIDSLQRPDAATIRDYYWLTSDLSGHVESPGYYFGDGAGVAKATDDLLLTHGWRRFRWEDIARNAPSIAFLPEYEGLTVQATITGKRTGRPARGVLSYISFADPRFQVSNAVSNDSGRAIFLARNVYGPHEMVVQPDSNRNEYRIDVADAFSPRRAPMPVPRFVLPEQWKDQLSAHHFNTRLANSFQPESAQQYRPPVTYDTSLFYGKPDKVYYLDDYTRFPTMEEVMREYITEVRVRKDKTGFQYEVMNAPARLFFNAAPLVLLDGMPVFNVDKIIAFDPLKVKKIDVVSRKYLWGNLAVNGIVSYATYDGDLAGFELDPSAVVMEFQGLQLQREFYQPDYSTAGQKNSRLPDARNVLLWKGDAFIDANGTISFYTSDLPGTYMIMIQGMGDGAPAVGSAFFTVNSR